MQGPHSLDRFRVPSEKYVPDRESRGDGERGGEARHSHLRRHRGGDVDGARLRARAHAACA